MQNQSLFVKIVIWLMIFLMSVGFAALVIAPFVQTSSLFGGSGSGHDATKELVKEARADIKKDDCTDTKPPIEGKRLDRCKAAFQSLASSYTTLTRPEEDGGEVPRDAKRNFDRAGDAWRSLYELDKDDEDSAVRYADYLSQAGKSQQSLDLWTKLVNEHPKNEDYLLRQAGVYTQLQQLDKAIATYQLFKKQFPESGQIEQIDEEIKNLQEQKKQQAAGGGQNAPISVN
jgi:tetratricopeptide (TPR) repeat protein